MRPLKTYLSILHKKGFYVCLQEAKKALCPVWFTRSRAAIEQIQAERVSRYLWRRYADSIEQPLAQTPQTPQPPKTIWLCWLQGEEQAPPMVKRCIESVRKYAVDYTIRLLTADNIEQTVDLPEYIWRKYKEGTISFTHFSDILRTALLVQHGGIWLDVTVLLTSPIPTTIAQQPLFFFQKSPFQPIPHIGSSWFIVAQKGNPVLQRVLDVLCEYWKKENVLRDYFLFHLILFLVVTRNEQGAAILKQMPYVTNAEPHLLQFRLFEQYNENEWNMLTVQSAIHKLSWKLTPSPVSCLLEDTYYYFILNALK